MNSLICLSFILDVCGVNKEGSLDDIVRQTCENIILGIQRVLVLVSRSRRSFQGCLRLSNQATIQISHFNFLITPHAGFE